MAAKAKRDEPVSHRTLDCRSFWKAGNIDVLATGPPRVSQVLTETSDFDRARVHPKFLHTNATSHKWAFGALAELLDNAVDEIQNGATFVKVDKIINFKDNSPMLLFQDDGGGMDPEGIRRCMSLGFSSKRSKTTIGQYGNGFKTSTMRLGADAIVFSRATRGSSVTMSIGLLSYTFLRRTMKDDIIVPMLDFVIRGGQIQPLFTDTPDDWENSLMTIIEWSPFTSKEDILLQFDDIGQHGTKVVVYNLWMNDDGLLELDFDDDEEDILLRDQAFSGGSYQSKSHREVVQSHISHTLKYSLRAYTSILYLRKFQNFRIILRGKPVEQLNFSEDMKFQKTVTYKPQVGTNAEDVSVRITVGFAKEAPVLGIFGLNVYHKNRLVMPFWKVLQEGSSRGRCVVGFLEANFIEPAHDKQDFERTPLFIRLETKLRQIILDYWKNNCHLIGYQSAATTAEKNRQKYFAQKLQKKLPAKENTNQVVSHLKSEVQAEELLIGAGTDNTRDQSAEYIDHAAINGQPMVQDSIAEQSSQQEDLPDIEPIGIMDSSTIEKLSEENIQLFMRREELHQSVARLKQTTEELERQLEEAKKNYSQLALELETRRKKRNVR